MQVKDNNSKLKSKVKGHLSYIRYQTAVVCLLEKKEI